MFGMVDGGGGPAESCLSARSPTSQPRSLCLPNTPGTFSASRWSRCTRQHIASLPPLVEHMGQPRQEELKSGQREPICCQQWKSGWAPGAGTRRDEGPLGAVMVGVFIGAGVAMVSLFINVH